MREFRPPFQIQQVPFDPMLVPNSLDNIFNMYAKMKEAKAQEMRAGLQDLTQRAQLASQGINPAAYDPNNPQAIEGLFTPLIEQAKKSRELKTRQDIEEIRKTQAQSRLAEGQASYFESLGTPGGVKPTTMEIGGVNYAVTPTPRGPNYQPIPERRPTQSEEAARQYADKAQQAHGSLSQLEQSGYKPSQLGNALQSVVPTALQTPEFQKLDQSRRQFINAILRRESGAAISASEYDNYTRQYFPVPGDSDGVKEQKAKARELAINGLAQEGARVPSQLKSAQALQPGSQAGIEERVLKGGKRIRVQRQANGSYVEVP